MNKDGTILIEKQYRERIPRQLIDPACVAVQDRSRPVPALIPTGDHTLLLHQQNEIWLVGVCDGDEFTLFGVSVLEYIGRLLTNLIHGGATEISVKTEFSAVYQILDYAVDGGLPFLNESNTIETLLTRPPTDYTKGHRLQLDFEHPWRMVGVKHSVNQLFIDCAETIDYIATGPRADFCHVRGAVTINCALSDDPHVALFFAPGTRWEDVTFHRCVEPETADRVIQFIPPDGQFVLLKYRITAAVSAPPLTVVPKFQWPRGGAHFDIVLKPDVNLPKPLEQVQIRFELPDGVHQPTLSPGDGKAVFESLTREVVWTLPAFAKKEPITLRGAATTDSGIDFAGRDPVVTARFITTGTLASGLRIEKVDVENVSYKAFRGVKYILRAGNYEFRPAAA
jgi:AP-3 complex subunit mu